MVLGSDAKVGQEGVLMQQNSVAKALHLPLQAAMYRMSGIIYTETSLKAI